MLKKIGCFIIFLIIWICHSNVYAATYSDKFDEQGMWISNEFVSKTKNGSTKYQQMTMITRKSDNRYVYCIEPGKSIDENKSLIGYDQNHHQYANLTLQQWDRIKLLAYYGYGYKDHTDIKWYVITQFMIWQTNNLGYDIYFTDKLNGNRIEKYTEEMIELDNLVNSQFKTPNFNVKTFDLFWGEEKIFVDKNNVLENYTINTGPNIEVSKNGNNLNIKSTNYGNSFITFKRLENRFFNKPIVYIDEENQDLLLPGDLDAVTDIIRVNMNFGSISINKLDYETKSNVVSHQGSLKNAKYGLYKETGELIEEQLTSSDGNITFNSKLNENIYYIQEIIPSEGYQLDDTKYYFEINKDNYNITLDVYEKVIKENFEIIKVLENEESGQLQFEKGIEFGVYDINNKLLKTYTTSDFGTIKFSLPYGKYILKQITSYEGYEKIEDYNLNVIENNKENKLVFKDNLIKYKVKINVKNKKTLENIENINFELYNKDNKKICYITNYPTENRICKYTTDKDGNILFPQYFNFNEYTIKLIYDENFEYVYDDENIKFIINSDTKYKQFDDYRLIELEYFLDIKQSDNTEDDNTFKPEAEIIDNEIDVDNEIEVDNEIITENKLEVEEGIIVEVPNTLKNSNYSILILLGLGLFIKKLLHH